MTILKAIKYQVLTRLIWLGTARNGKFNFVIETSVLPLVATRAIIVNVAN